MSYNRNTTISSTPDSTPTSYSNSTNTTSRSNVDGTSDKDCRSRKCRPIHDEEIVDVEGHGFNRSSSNNNKRCKSPTQDEIIVDVGGGDGWAPSLDGMSPGRSASQDDDLDDDYEGIFGDTPGRGHYSGQQRHQQQQTPQSDCDIPPERAILAQPWMNTYPVAGVGSNGESGSSRATPLDPSAVSHLGFDDFDTG